MNHEPRAMVRSSSRLVLLALACSVAAAPAAAQPTFRGRYDAYHAAASMQGAVPRDVPAGLRVAGEDAQRGVPTLLVGSADVPGAGANTAAGAAWAHLSRLAPLYGLGAADVGAAQVALARTTAGGGALVVFRQRAFGIPVIGAKLSMLLDSRGRLRVAGGYLHPTAHRRYAFRHDQAQAVSAALADAWIRPPPSTSLVTPLPVAPGGQTDLYFAPTAAARSAGYVLDGPARTRRVLFPLPTRLVPATYVELWLTDPTLGPILVAYVISAEDRKVLSRALRTDFESFSYTVFADGSAPFLPVDSPFGDVTPDAVGAPSTTLPPFVTQDVVVMEGFNTNPEGVADPWLPDGATETRGNNVDAYADLVSPDGFNAGDLRAAVTSPGTFDHLFDPLREPDADETQTSAVVTQLFFVNNWLHDYFYDLGFDEAAGNAQEDNFGRGGEEGDSIRAQAMDYSGFNNASMSTPDDGGNPRMQMYLWQGRADAGVEVGASTYDVGVARWGPSVFDLMASTALVDDGVATGSDGCEPIAADLTGLIALVDRGNCSFWVKVFNAQEAGAAGVIVMNDRATGTTTMSGTPSETITIPSLMVSRADGAVLRGASLGMSTRMFRTANGPRPDSSLDATVVVHEWGHYLHGRLTDGSSQQRRAMGEGWGDVLAVVMLARTGDDFAGAHPHAGFSNHGREFIYFGTRRMPYSTSRAINDLSFRHISVGEALPTTHPIDPTSANNAEVHNAGEVWASMMHDAFAALVDRSRAADAPYTFEEAKARFASYIVLGMQLVPRDPTFTEQRDAIVAAALDSDPDDARLIAVAFAGRGAGSCAVSPARDSTDLVGVVEDFTVGAVGAIEPPEVVTSGAGRRCDPDGLLDAGEDGVVRVVVHNTGLVDFEDVVLTLESGELDVVFPAGTAFPVSALAPGGSETLHVPIGIPEGASVTDYVRLTATLSAPAFCDGVSAEARFAMDRDAETSSIETFDLRPDWLVESSLDGTTTGVWSVGPSTLGGESRVLRAIDSSSLTDTAVELPPVVASRAESLVLSFSHRFSFEASSTVLWDGGVIELTFDGRSWTDVSTYVDPGYTGAISDRAGSPISLRQAYSRDNPSLPDADDVVLDFGMALAGRPVRFRFRVATDRATGGAGWEIDDVSITGATPAPFTAFVPDEASCAGAPVADAGPDVGVYPGETFVLDAGDSFDPDGDPLTFRWEALPSAPSFPFDGADTETVELVAPWVDVTTDFELRVLVSDGFANAADDVRVRVFAGITPPEGSDLPLPDGAIPDGGTDGEVDAAPDLRKLGGGGCSCRVTSPPVAPRSRGMWLGFVVVLVAWRRGRRRG